jgi:hypothetical protein
MKSLSLSAFALSLAVASTASAQLATSQLSTSTLNTAVATDGVVVTQWSGLAGTVYTPFQKLTADQQAVELRGAIPVKEASATATETRINLPIYASKTEVLPYGFGNTEVVTRVAQSEACPTTLAAPLGSFNKVWSKSNTYGNSTFGAGYLGTFTLNATGATGTANDRISAEAKGTANVTVLGATGGIEGYAYGKIQNTTASDTMYLKILGTSVWSHSGAATMSVNPSWSRTLASASTLIWLGPVPVTLSAKGSGTIGVQASFGYSGGVLAAKARPYGNLKATASAGVDLLVAAAGVSANLTLINASLPAVASLSLATAADGKSQFKYDLDLDASLNTLSGNVQLWAKVWYLFGSKKWTTTVASWSGITATYPIVDVHTCSGKFTL